jgi:hypothetical protein
VYADVSEKHAVSIFRVEHCNVGNRWGYIGKHQGRLSFTSRGQWKTWRPAWGVGSVSNPKHHSMKNRHLGNLDTCNREYEEYYLLGYYVVYSVESQPTLRRNMSPPSSGSNKPSKMPAWKQVASQLGLFDLEDGDNMFLRNVSWLPTDYTAWEPQMLQERVCFITKNDIQQTTAYNERNFIKFVFLIAAWRLESCGMWHHIGCRC